MAKTCCWRALRLHWSVPSPGARWTGWQGQHVCTWQHLVEHSPMRNFNGQSSDLGLTNGELSEIQWVAKPPISQLPSCPNSAPTLVGMSQNHWTPLTFKRSRCEPCISTNCWSWSAMNLPIEQHLSRSILRCQMRSAITAKWQCSTSAWRSQQSSPSAWQQCSRDGFVFHLPATRNST